MQYFSSIGSFNSDCSVYFRSHIIVLPLWCNNTSEDESNGTPRFICKLFIPVVACLSAAMFSCAHVKSVETSIVVSSSWWLDTDHSFHLLSFGIGF